LVLKKKKSSRMQKGEEIEEEVCRSILQLKKKESGFTEDIKKKKTLRQKNKKRFGKKIGMSEEEKKS